MSNFPDSPERKCVISGLSIETTGGKWAAKGERADGVHTNIGLVHRQAWKAYEKAIDRAKLEVTGRTDAEGRKIQTNNIRDLYDSEHFLLLEVFGLRQTRMKSKDSPAKCSLNQ